MQAETQTWQFSLRTLLIVVAVVAMWCGLFVAFEIIGLLIATLLHGVEMAVAGNRRGQRRLAWTGYALIALPLLTFYFGCYTVYHLRFSPDTFTFRNTTHWEWCGTRISGEKDRELSKPLIAYLREEGYIESTDLPHPRWDYVHGHMPGVKGMRGEAKPAYRVFRRDELIEWSKNHPKQARYIWPRIIEHTRQRRYYLAEKIAGELDGFEGTTEELGSVVAQWETNWIE
jgi:hypothetical protein